jgi:peptidoglycan-associated lipoprotein
MRRTIVQTVTGVAIVAGLVGACGSEGSTGAAGASGANAASSSGAAVSSPDAGASSAPGQGVGDAAQHVTAALQQALQQAPVTFEPEKADLTAPAKQVLEQIAKAMQGNDVKLDVATHAGYPDAAKAKTLSEQRADAIATTLEGLGVAKDRVQTDATGNEKAQGDQALNTQISVTQ